MNITGRKPRRLLALCSTVVVASGVLVTSVAKAQGGLGIDPATTTVTTLNLGASAAMLAGTNGALANATYAVRVTTATTELRLSLDSAPTTSSNLSYNADAVDGPNGPTDAWSGPLTTLTPGTSDLSDPLVPPSVYLTADVPGTYILHFVDTLGTLDPADDILSPPITLNVKDVLGNTITTTDDWVPAVAAPVSVGVSDPITSVVPLSELTLVDARGSSAGVGVLDTQIASLVGLSFLGGGVIAPPWTDPTPVSPAGARTLQATTTTIAAPVVSTAFFNTDGAGAWAPIGTPAVTTLTSNGVTGVTLASVGVPGSVYANGANIGVKTGTASVTYTATVTDPDIDRSGDVVYFTLGGTNVGSLSTDGTTVDAANHIFAAVTNGAGVASLTVTTSDTAAGTTYTVTANSNGQSAGPLTVLYADPTIDSVVLTNTVAQLFPQVNQPTVTLTGTLYDQFGEPFQPDAGQVAVEIPIGNVVGNVTVTNGMFSYTYTPPNPPTVGEATTFRLSFGGQNTTGTIRWTAMGVATSVTLNTPNANATGVKLSNSGMDTLAGLAPGQGNGPTDFGNLTGEITGMINDASNAGMPYAPVTISGSQGVYFSTGSNGANLASSITTVADANGRFGGVYAFFTRAGPATITAFSGPANVSRSVTTETSNDPYTVTIEDVTALPGETTVVTGTINDAFGNPVPGKRAELSLDSGTLGTLGSNTVVTNASGVFTTTFVAGSGQGGTATITATLYNVAQSALLTGDPTADAAWQTTAGITVPAGHYQATGDVTVTPETVTISAPPSRVGSGSVVLTGHAEPNTAVQIYAKPTRPDAAFVWIKTVTTDGDGDYSTTTSIAVPTTFVARTTNVVSTEVTTEMVVITAPEWQIGGGTITVWGTAIPGATVTIKQKPSGAGSFTTVGTATASELTGDFSFDMNLTKTTQIRAETTNVTSTVVTTKVESTVVLTVTQQVGRRLQLMGNGAPDAVGTMVFYEYRNNGWVTLASVTTNAQGVGSFSFPTTAGSKRLRVVYTAPGTYSGTDYMTFTVS